MQKIIGKITGIIKDDSQFLAQNVTDKTLLLSLSVKYFIDLKLIFETDMSSRLNHRINIFICPWVKSL